MIVGYSRTFGGVTPVDITIPPGTTFAGSETDNTTYTFASLAFGADAGSRAIIAVIAGSDNASGAAVSSVTIGGHAATLAVAARTNIPAGQSGSVEIFIAEPSGTSGSVVVNWDQTMQRCGVQVYRMTGHGSIVPHDTDTDIDGSNPQTGSLDVPANGAALAGSTNNAASSDYAWSGLPEDVDADYVTNSRLSSAHDEFVSQQTGLSISATIDTSLNRTATAFASWGP